MTLFTNTHDNAVSNNENIEASFDLVNQYLAHKKLPPLYSGSQVEQRVGTATVSENTVDYFFGCDHGQYGTDADLDASFESTDGFARIVIYTDGIYVRHSTEAIARDDAADRMREACLESAGLDSVLLVRL